MNEKISEWHEAHRELEKIDPNMLWCEWNKVNLNAEARLQRLEKRTDFWKFRSAARHAGGVSCYAQIYHDTWKDRKAEVAKLDGALGGESRVYHAKWDDHVERRRKQYRALEKRRRQKPTKEKSMEIDREWEKEWVPFEEAHNVKIIIN
jgi:hypothetical protein